MAKFDKKKLDLTRQSYYNFQVIFNVLYKAFAEGKQFVRIRNESSYDRTETIVDKKVGVSIPELGKHSYSDVKRVMVNLMANELARVMKIKPKKPQGSKDRVYSYLQVYPTDKGRAMYEHDGECPIPYWRKESPQVIRIGKTYRGYDHLKTKFDPYKERLSVAMSRWYDEWMPAFDGLFEQTMINMTDTEAEQAIDTLIQKTLIPKLPVRKNVAAIRNSLKQNMKLAQF